MHRRAPTLLLALVACAACGKVPLRDVNAAFSLADAAWFAEEETLFFFWRMGAEQGLGPDSVIEVSWVTDQAAQPWIDVTELTSVHTHLAVDCGANGRCGSQSIHVPLEPRQVALRLRYHREGEVFLDAPLSVHVVGPGPAHANRSLIVYGVFDETNTRVQWRGRHQFPALRNEEAQALGLRRWLKVSYPGYGEIEASGEDNPYGYASDPCSGQVPLGWPAVETTERARFDEHSLPLAASTSAGVCARSTVTDAKGTFVATAVARKNPQVRAAFPSMHSPIRPQTRLGWLLKPCHRTISEQHLQMQAQRLLLESPDEVCIDDFDRPGFADSFAARLRARIDQRRAEGRDMVITLALHHDDATGQLAALVEQVLEQELSFEAAKSSPRAVGAFVYDSVGHALGRPGLNRLALWCPASVDEANPTTSMQSCPLQPDMPDIQIGPVKFNQLPILPTRAQYLEFVGKYSEGLAGRVTAWTFLAPERTPLSENVLLGEYGVATFFNEEVISAEPDDAFSFCATEELAASLAVFRHPMIPDPLPISALPEAHAAAPQENYPLGLAWDFPFLARLQYETSLAGAATAYGFTIPFGIESEAEAYHGTAIWQASEFPLTEALTQCTRFCDHPTFDSAGVYNVRALFRSSYGAQCYRPRYPLPGDGGFPLDP